jgi:2-polyprenyl-6-methoxyphenol hydroxylase-like FAD-dependent oxidoreductase
MTGSEFIVIFVGAGFAGLATAIECTQRGMKVKVYESARKLTALGGYFLLHRGRLCRIIYFALVQTLCNHKPRKT